jgi:radical SAM superfamily enzyme YgiQ (UPF0313 family)
MFGKAMRHRSVENIIDEIEQLKRRYRFRNLYFVDDELLFNGEAWLEELCAAFINKNLGIAWTCQARVDQIRNESLLKLMKRSGCYSIGFGVESGSQQILNYMRKGYRTSQIDSAFALCRRIGIVTTCNVMVGTPQESPQTIQDTIDMIKRVRPNLIRISITTPTPGSDLYLKMAKENRITVSNLSDFDRWLLNPIKLDDFSEDDIRSSTQKILKQFYRVFFRMLYNPLNLFRNFYFLRVLLARYCNLLLTDPRRFLQDLSFYFHYAKVRQGRK